ncbi:Leucine-rich repeat and guanylate kinase domain-containing protein [Durusdinium trenchii]|uniref:Leucine-rich repeat and guanylate kinase domain-containing protein n=1 Tax=Durusdinium trenchii TaxID=1381693 RepID=A0ABP0KJ03_9DINO
MLYHWLVISYLLYGIVTVSYELSLCHFDSGMQPEICDASWPPLAVDLFLMLGSCLVLMSLGGFWNYADTTKLVAQSAEELMSYCEQNSLDEAWKSWSCSEPWNGAEVDQFDRNVGRFGLYGWAVWKGEEQLDLSVVTFASKFSISTGVLIFACFWQVRTSHAMALIVNAWSACLLMGVCSCMESRNTWRRVSGLFRKTSRTFERCCGALGLIIVGLVFSALYDLRQGRGEEVLASVSVAVIIPGVLWTHACTTTACNRLPSLVTLCEGSDEDEDEEYTGLAMFLSLSECGFFVSASQDQAFTSSSPQINFMSVYSFLPLMGGCFSIFVSRTWLSFYLRPKNKVWDTCLTVGLVQKFLYFTAAMAGTIGFQTGALNFKS